MSEGEIIITRRVEELAPERLMSKMVLSFTVLGKPMKIHIEFKEPVPIDEVPRTVLEADEQILEDLQADVFVHRKETLKVIEEVADAEECEESDSE